ncbi:DUF1318 domain-containing protein [Prosthecobacter sp.]|uniref:DUF1318 domain-containing protein n=1 Tax=Prosthecobacter sp. TaxID=1965333 RepID=UPI001D5699B0|nr:DUF1318 domain-containing protein [Prosthecobacter sp.]MCB1277146.1 DUF1318 domain-containing protein [Prosthecobacter sp.]
MQWSDFNRLALALGTLGLGACKQLPEIPITTPKPLEVNLNMRLDVYQYRGDEPLDKEATKGAGEATERMRNRMGEIQTLKNNQLVGEDHRGLLLVREVPAGEWGPQMKKTVADENEDRMLLMRRKAKETNRPLHEIEAEQWRLRTQQAGTGEWIEVPGASPGSFQWKRAGADTAPPASPSTTTPTKPTS